MDEVFVDQWGEQPAFGAVEHRIGADGGGVVGGGLEAVGVVPEGVGAGVLVVDEAVGWGVVEDGGFPLEWDVVDLELVADLAARAHLDGFWGKDLEVEEAGSEFFEVVGIGEEGEDGVDGMGEVLGGDELPDAPEGGVGVGFDVDAG